MKPEITQLHDDLLTWFKTHHEDLPWRRDRSPYAVWVSEIMLQQTQVITVIPYYERFMARFPTVEVLAAAPLDDVLKGWEGLGYYSRARNLHRAAGVVVHEHGGQFPASVEGLLSLPGIGRYTAGAVGSLAFNLDVSLLDGNVIRVLTRWFDRADDVMQTTVKNDLWALADHLLPEGHAGVWNEGLMELGRLICTPKSPYCASCPVQRHCAAYQAGTQHERPVKSAPKARPHYDVAAAVIRAEDGRVLIAQRPLDKMLGGLWEFPGGKREDGETLQECLEREIQEELGMAVAVGAQITTLQHAYTHFRITLYAFECRPLSGAPQAIGCAAWAWVTLAELDRYAFPTTDRKVIEVLRGKPGQLALI